MNSSSVEWLNKCMCMVAGLLCRSATLNCAIIQYVIVDKWSTGRQQLLCCQATTRVLSHKMWTANVSLSSLNVSHSLSVNAFYVSVCSWYISVPSTANVILGAPGGTLSNGGYTCLLWDAMVRYPANAQGQYSRSTYASHSETKELRSNPVNKQSVADLCLTHGYTFP